MSFAVPTLLLSQFTLTSLNNLVLTSDMQDQITKVSSLPRKSDPLYATVGAFSTWCTSTDGICLVTIPGVSGNFSVSPLRVDYISETEYTYIGKIAGEANANFALTRNEEGITGFAFIGSTYYFFYPLEGNNVIVIKDNNAPAGIDCGLESPETTESSSAIDFCAYSEPDCYAVVDILLLIHPNAFNTIPAGFTTLSTQVMNAIFLNSNIINKDFRFRLVTLPSSITFLLSAGSPGGDIIAFMNNGAVQDLRASYKADTVVLLVNTTWTTPSGGTVFGVAGGNGASSIFDIGPGVSKKGAYAIVNRASALGVRLTLPHEIAHNWGARHARPTLGDDPTKDCSHAHIYTGSSGTVRPTVLGTLGTSGARIPFYSNPEISFDGFPTGLYGDPSTTSANNVQKIRNAFCHVENYFSPAKLYAQIGGYNDMCPGDNFNYIALVTNGSDLNETATTFVWSYSNTPGGPYTTLSTGNANNAWVNYSLGTPGGILYLRLRITTAAGTVYNAFDRINIKASCIQGGSIERNEIVDDGIKNKEGLYIYPNPAESTVTIGTKGAEGSIYSIQIIDINGSIVRANNTPSLSPLTTFDVSNLPSGLYFVRFMAASGNKTLPLSIVKH
jgi:hypothetical protein